MPSPAAPRTVNSRQLRSSAARANARVRSSSSRSRPTIVDRSARRACPVSETTWINRWAGTGSAFPLSESGSTGSASTASRTRAWVPSPIRISPGSAAASSRAAVFTASPVTRPKSVESAPTSTSPGVHADPAGEPNAVVAFELVVEAFERRAHVDGGADRSERVVLVQLRDAEHRHHGVPDELLDRASVAFERGAHRVEVTGHDLAHGLGVELFAELGRARHVAEQDRDGLADLGSFGDVEACAADRAEVRPLGVLRPAVRTGRHGRSLGRWRLGSRTVRARRPTARGDVRGDAPKGAPSAFVRCG